MVNLWSLKPSNDSDRQSQVDTTMFLTKLFLLAGAALGGISVVLGAFGAHALRNSLSESSLSAWQTGVQYQMFHALALLLIGVLMQRSPMPLLSWAGGFMLLGIVLFSGSLYLLSLTSLRWPGPVTPLGGVAFIIAWSLLAVAVMRLGNSA